MTETIETRAREVLASEVTRDAGRGAYRWELAWQIRSDVSGLRLEEIDLDDIIRAMLAFQSEARAGEGVVESIALDVAETITTHMRSPDMIWGLGRIDPALLDEMEAELRSITVAALTNALASLNLPAPVAHQGEREQIRQSIIRQLGDDPHADRIILPGTDWDIILGCLSLTPSAGRDGSGGEDLVSLHEAAQDLIAAKLKDCRAVGYRDDLWNCLAAILAPDAVEPLPAVDGS